MVVKADGLAAGKGALVCTTLDEASEAVAACMEKRVFGEAGAAVVVEEFLRGEEVSFHVITNGREVLPLASAQDHKTIFDGDRGPNTGGMGSYSPFAPMGGALEARIITDIVQPIFAALSEEGAVYRGVLYVGLMLTADGPKVVEFNCRFGDPECQAILVRAEGDLVPLLLAAARGEPLPKDINWAGNAAACVTLGVRRLSRSVPHWSADQRSGEGGEPSRGSGLPRRNRGARWSVGHGRRESVECHRRGAWARRGHFESVRCRRRHPLRRDAVSEGYRTPCGSGRPLTTRILPADAAQSASREHRRSGRDTREGWPRELSDGDLLRTRGRHRV